MASRGTGEKGERLDAVSSSSDSELTSEITATACVCTDYETVKQCVCAITAQ